MHVGFRSSGGRGEYEIVGVHGEIHASDLIGWTVDWELPTLGFR